MCIGINLIQGYPIEFQINGLTNSRQIIATPNIFASFSLSSYDLCLYDLGKKMAKPKIMIKVTR